MRENLDSRELVQSIGPVVVAVLALATAPTWEHRLSTPSPEQIYPLFVLSALGVLLALYAPKGRHTLCLGTLVLPPTIWFFGVSWAAWVGAGVYLLREIMRRLLYGEPLQRAKTIRLLPTVADGSRIALATWRGSGLDARVADSTSLERSRPLLTLGPTRTAGLCACIADSSGRCREVSASLGALVGSEAFRSLGLDASGWILGSCDSALRGRARVARDTPPCYRHGLAGDGGSAKRPLCASVPWLECRSYGR